jgi:IS30 family transposase
LTKLQRKTAELTKRAVTERLANHRCSSLTLDNGSENTRHEEIAKILRASVYFCHPYHSWEKGSVENINGCVRRYFPRGVSIQTVSQSDLDDVAWELNNRPRKILGFATPTEVLQSEYIKLNVAVRLRM